MNLSSNSLKVSVICPAYNAQENIGVLISSLCEQSYPAELMEIIIIDNHSTDRTKEIVRTFPVILLEENEKQSSYAARNLGIAQAKGDVLAFIDADCIADPQWIKEGVLALQQADLAGGRVEFLLSGRRTSSEIFDSMTSMKADVSIKENGAAATANLFVKAELFKKLGFFPEVKSGGDMQWTRLATQQGCSLIYAPRAIVRHPARGLKEVLVKSLRVGKGYPPIWEKFNVSNKERFEVLLRKFFPQKPSSIRKLIETRAPGRGYESRLLSIWWVSYVASFTTGVGIIMCLSRGLKTKSSCHHT
jgi:glycosyltransferase involved in cell wall biosynthesis